MASKMANNLVGTAGEYYVCAELCRRGYLALLTPKNNPLFDVVATNAEGRTAVSIQVKTRSVGNTQGWKLSTQVGGSETPGVPFQVSLSLCSSTCTMTDCQISISTAIRTLLRAFQKYFKSTLQSRNGRMKHAKIRAFAGLTNPILRILIALI